MSRSNWSTEEPCLHCGLVDSSRVCYHHVLHRGSYPEFQNESWNKAPVCSAAHVPLWHSKGTVWMAAHYPNVAQWLADNGWSIRDGKWIPKLWS